MKRGENRERGREGSERDVEGGRRKREEWRDGVWDVQADGGRKR